MIRAERVRKVYDDGTLALQDINLHVKPGELLYLVGESGAGKTTLLKLFLHMEPVSAGRLEVAGISLDKPRPEAIRRLRRLTGVVLQDFRLIMGRTALENIALSLRVLGVPWPENQARSRGVLSALGLTEKVNSRIETLSWGQRQRVALGRALVREPRLLLADEPTGNLDGESVAFVAAGLSLARDQGATVVVATHDSRLLEALPGRVVMLAGGRLNEGDKPAQKERGVV